MPGKDGYTLTIHPYVHHRPLTLNQNPDPMNPKHHYDPTGMSAALTLLTNSRHVNPVRRVELTFSRQNVPSLTLLQWNRTLSSGKNVKIFKQEPPQGPVSSKDSRAYAFLDPPLNPTTTPHAPPHHITPHPPTPPLHTVGPSQKTSEH